MLIHNSSEQSIWSARVSQVVNIPALGAVVLTVMGTYHGYGMLIGAWRGTELQELLPLVAWGIRGAWIALVGWLLWRVIATFATSYALTSQRLRVREGVLNRSREEVELYRVHDLSLYKPLLLRVFGRAHLTVHSADPSHPVLRIRAVRQPEMVYETFRQTVATARASANVRVGEYASPEPGF